MGYNSRMVCGAVTNLIEFLEACVKAKKEAAASGTEIQMPKLKLKGCRRKAIFAARIDQTRHLHFYCAEHFLSNWLHADLSKKVQLL